jgi:hypothetical protein
MIKMVSKLFMVSALLAVLTSAYDPASKLLHYEFWDNAGQICYDSSGNKNHGIAGNDCY